MKRYLLFIFGCTCLLLVTAKLKAQSATQNKYVKYNELIGEAIRKRFLSGEENKHKTIEEIRAAATSLVDEHAPVASVPMLKGNSKVLDDEEIYKRRKNSVFIFGKMFSSDPKEVKSDIAGTAFAISADGICITNYHVLKDLIRKDWVPNKEKKDSIYFIMSADKKIYLIDSILAFSKNNDLAVFKVNTRGEKLNPIPLGKPADPGAPVYCLSNPYGHFYSFSKGITARNVEIDSVAVTEGYNKNGRPPIRMEITADYAIGSSGGPILDKYGNLIGVVISTTPLGTQVDPPAGSYIQMVVKETSPVQALIDLLTK